MRILIRLCLTVILLIPLNAYGFELWGGGGGTGASTVGGITDWATAGVTDYAYDAAVWDGITSVAPSMDAVRDKIESIVSLADWADWTVVTVTDTDSAISGVTVEVTDRGSYIFNADSAITITDFILTGETDHTGLTDQSKFRFILADTDLILDCSENTNIEGNGGHDYTGHATQLPIVESYYSTNYSKWMLSLIVAMDDAVTLALDVVGGRAPVFSYSGVAGTTQLSAISGVTATATQEEVTGSVIWLDTNVDAAILLPTPDSSYSGAITHIVACYVGKNISVRCATDYYLNGTLVTGGDSSTILSTTFHEYITFEVVYDVENTAYVWAGRSQDD